MQYPDTHGNPFDKENSGNILSVSSLNRMARSLLESHFPAVIVEGEISNLAIPSSGHWYLTLKDKSAQIRCAMFVNRNRMVRFKPENGKQIIIRGRLSIYEGRGDYQLLVDGMEEAGAGALQRAFEELKAKLLGEGLFAEQAKQPVLSRYEHIGVITSPTGAAIQDILSVFSRRFPATRITLFPVAVQGKDAAVEIVKAIELANRHAAKLNLQALIVGRGGGSLEDLQAFNEESVARAIYASDLAICSAVGHEVDFTIADFVADLRAPTPSAAAELMSPDQQDYFELLLGYQTQFQNTIRQSVQRARQQLLWLIKQLKHPDRRLQEQAQNLDRLDIRMRRAMRESIGSQKAELTQLRRSLLASSPGQKLQHSQLQLSNSLKRLKQAIQALSAARQSSLGVLSRSLNAVSPLNTLARGYSITYDESEKVIRNSDDVKVGSKIISRLDKGRITSTIESVTSDEP
jgi:exodeoxyribonuclease VII large subunit